MSDSALPPSEKSVELKGQDGSQVQWTEEEERRVVRKLDLVLLPGLSFLYLLSFLDRSNIGNAKLFNLLPDIGITDASDYNTALALYFAGYVLFEVPSNIVIKKLNPRIWLPTLTIVWGVTATLQGLVVNRAGFYAARFFLGVTEAGLFPGIVFVFSMFYKRNERHWRISVLFGGAALAGAFGGILAYGVSHPHSVTFSCINGATDWSHPRWCQTQLGVIFFIEGIFTVLVGLSAYFWVPYYPQKAKFLTERERAIVLARLESDVNGGDHEPFNWKGVRSAFTDPLVLLYAALFHGFAFPLYSLSLFLPTIITQLGYGSYKAQLLTIPVYAAAFIFILIFAWIAHRTKLRGLWIMSGGLIAIVGYIVLLTTTTAGARYAGAFITVIGVYVAVALLLSWPAENVSPSTKRAVATGMQIFIGDMGAIVGVLIYRPSLSGHFYRTAHFVALGYTIFGIVVAASPWYLMWRRNVRNAQYDIDESEQPDRLLIAKEEGDRSKSYRFQL